MKHRMAFMMSSFTVVLLLVAICFIAGCEQDRSPVVPDQEYLMAPGNGNPNINANDDDEDDDGEPEPKGKAKGNPHVDGDPDADADADSNSNKGGNGKGKGNPNVDGNPNPGSNGRGRGRPSVSGLDGLVRRRGAAKATLSDNGDIAGWVIANTTHDNDEGVEGGDVEVFETDDTTLIITVHLNAGAEDWTYNIDVTVDVNGNDTTYNDAGTLTTNHKGKGTAQVKINLGVVEDDDDLILVVVTLDGYSTVEMPVPLKK